MRIAFYTLGCKVNQYETSALMQQFAAADYTLVDPDEDAEVYVLNSCTVTAEGDRKSRQMLRRFRRKSPEALLCLTGCFPQAFPERAAQIAEADIIMGSKNRSGLLAAVEQRLAGKGQRVAIAPHQREELFEPLRAEISPRTRALVKIQDGCDRYCAYCIIPTARGPVRSKPLEDLQDELQALAAAGHREVVLTGINLSSYGRGMGLRLLDALQVACAIPGIARVRLGSLEPERLTVRDISSMAALPALCPQFHLSLQSGCDATLHRMRRRYTTAEYRRVAADLRQAFPGCALTTDSMVGFPGETQAEFAASCEFVQEMAFAKAHVFAYSRRPGTAAADFPDQVPKAVKQERARQMAAVCAAGRTAFLEAQVGRQARVLLETRTEAGVWEGYTENYTPVVVAADDAVQGQILPVAITGVDRDGDRCIARPQQENGVGA